MDLGKCVFIQRSNQLNLSTYNLNQMKNLSVLMGLFDHLNKNNSKTFIEHFDSETGVITFSGNLELNVKKIISGKDLALYINAKEECKTQFS